MSVRAQLIVKPTCELDLVRRLPIARDFHQCPERLLWLDSQGIETRLVVVWEGDEIVASAVLERSIHQWFLWKGPIGRSAKSETLEAILSECSDLRPVTLVLQPEWVWENVLARAGFNNNGAFSTLLVPAQKDPKAILAQMKDSTRRRVKRGIQAGLAFDGYATNLNAFYPIYETSMISAQSPDFASLQELQSLLSVPRVHLFLAYLGKEIVAGSICFENQDAFEARYVATHAAYRNIAPLNFVHFESLQKAARIGLRYLDLSGLATEPDVPKLANINRFKVGFGGMRFDYPMFVRV
jgi:hypothetical protein